jgi:hypothetical protein
MIIRVCRRPPGEVNWSGGVWYEGWQKFEEDCPSLAGFMKRSDMLRLEYVRSDGSRTRVTVEER